MTEEICSSCEIFKSREHFEDIVYAKIATKENLAPYLSWLLGRKGKECHRDEIEYRISYLKLRSRSALSKALIERLV